MADFLVTGDTPANFDALFATTPQVYAPQIEDNVFSATLFFHFLNKNGRKKVLNGGNSIAIPLMYAANSTVDSISDYGEVNIDPQEGITQAQYAWKQYVGSISISDMELAKNNSIEGAVSLLGGKIEQTELSLRDRLNTDGLGSNETNALNIFGAQDFMEPAVPASQDRVVGGIDPAANSWWRNRFDNIQDNVRGAVGSATPQGDNDGGTFSTNGLDAMTFQYNETSEGSDHPDIFIGNQSFFDNFEKSIVFNERLQRIAETDVGRTGFDTLMFKGAMVGFDNAVTTNDGGHIYTINSRYINWVVHRDFNFRMTPVQKFNSNQMARTGHIQLIAALTLSNKKRQGVIINADTFE